MAKPKLKLYEVVYEKTLSNSIRVRAASMEEAMFRAEEVLKKRNQHKWCLSIIAQYAPPPKLIDE